MTIKDKIQLSKNISIVAGIFCVVVAALLLLNYWQYSQIDPIESHVIETLVNRLKAEPNNELLIHEIRSYDLLARKAYFNSQWQIKTGSWLLFIGAVVLTIALSVYYNLQSGIEAPDKEHENEIAGRILAQKWIIVTGLLIFGLALIASFSTVNYLERYQLEVAGNPETSEVTEEEIEIIDVGTATEVMVDTNDANRISENTDRPPEAEDIPPAGEQSGTVLGEMLVKESLTVLSEELIKQNHNSFRGPLSQGVSYHTGIPVQWNGTSGDKILWKVPVPGKGFNSPVIWEDKIFVSGADSRTMEVYCYSRFDGKLLWTAVANDIPGSPAAPPRVSDDTGLAAPTVSTDGNSVFAIFATGDLLAVDMEGSRKWARNLGVPDNHYGHASSLIVWEDKLLVQFDTNKGGKLMALNTASGETLWETAREAKISWASPVLVQVDGKCQVVLTADPIVAGYDVQTGAELWSAKCMMGEVGPSVAYYDRVIYAANEYARLAAIDIKTGEMLWENDMYLPETASPLAVNGLVFIATSYGVLACYDSKTGEQYWEHDVGKTLYSSPVYADNKIYMMDNDGVMRIYECGKAMNLLAENELGEPASTTPAFADGQIIIRGRDNLYCITN